MGDRLWSPFRVTLEKPRKAVMGCNCLECNGGICRVAHHISLSQADSDEHQQGHADQADGAENLVQQGNMSMSMNSADEEALNSLVAEKAASIMQPAVDRMDKMREWLDERMQDLTAKLDAIERQREAAAMQAPRTPVTHHTPLPPAAAGSTSNHPIVVAGDDDLDMAHGGRPVAVPAAAAAAVPRSPTLGKRTMTDKTSSDINAADEHKGQRDSPRVATSVSSVQPDKTPESTTVEVTSPPLSPPTKSRKTASTPTAAPTVAVLASRGANALAQLFSATAAWILLMKTTLAHRSSQERAQDKRIQHFEHAWPHPTLGHGSLEERQWRMLVQELEALNDDMLAAMAEGRELDGNKETTAQLVNAYHNIFQRASDLIRMEVEEYFLTEHTEAIIRVAAEAYKEAMRAPSTDPLPETVISVAITRLEERLLAERLAACSSRAEILKEMQAAFKEAQEAGNHQREVVQRFINRRPNKNVNTPGQVAVQQRQHTPPNAAAGSTSQQGPSTAQQFNQQADGGRNGWPTGVYQQPWRLYGRGQPRPPTSSWGNSRGGGRGGGSNSFGPPNMMGFQPSGGPDFFLPRGRGAGGRGGPGGFGQQRHFGRGGYNAY